MDPLEWLARLADHIPDPLRHRTHFSPTTPTASVASGRTRENRPTAAKRSRRRGAAARHTWARLIARVFQADPLVCRRCFGPLRVVAYITDALAIRQILKHPDLSPPEKPPPEIRDVARVPVDEEGREIELQPA